ncbi:hypothetical protein OO17_01325 [Rhodopseudomonas palustris]|uniref:Uncharacterized protein n=1 Tax=Rhodopseudomonas palustris TaxID=1076 RepID=A0A0D7F4D5_RHOPL|nr:hypothetical protein OO17_01325 [Rhodopseudomonas palustris]
MADDSDIVGPLLSVSQIRGGDTQRRHLEAPDVARRAKPGVSKDEMYILMVRDAAQARLLTMRR